MLYFGLIAVGAAVWYLISAYVGLLRDKEKEYNEICELLMHIRGALSSGGGTLSRIIRSFKSDTLLKNGLLNCLGLDISVVNESSETNRAKDAFFRDKLYDVNFIIEKSDADKLISYLKKFGKSYLEEEKQKLTEITEYFRIKACAFSEKSDKNIKVTRILFAFCFIAAFILLL